MKGLRYLVTLLIGAILTGCIMPGPVRNCEDIALTPLQSLMYEPMSAEQTAQQISEIFQLSIEAVTVNRIEAPSTAAPWLNKTYHMGDVLVSWSKATARYVLHTRDNRMHSVGVAYDEAAPSADQVIKCLGAPEKYWSYYSLGPVAPTKRLADLFMFYPALGIDARALKSGSGEQPPRFDGAASVIEISLVPPGAEEDVIARFLSNRSPDMQGQITEQLRPWPEKWEDIVVEMPR